MRAGAEGAARIDHDGDRVCGRLLPRRPDPQTADADAVVEGAPAVLPALGHVVHLDDVEAERRLVRVDGVRAVELLDALGEDVEQERELRLSADDDVAPQRNALLSLSKSPFGLAVRALVGMLVELAQKAALLVAEVARYEDVDEDPLVAAAAPLQDGHATAAEDDDLARLRPRRQLELLLPVERRDCERGAERGLRERQVDGRVDVVALAHEALVGTDPHLDVDVAGRAADEPGVPLAAQADLLAVVDPRRDVDRQRPLLDDAAGAAALGARLLDPAARAGARRAGLRADELAEDAPRHLLQPPGSVARGAGRDLGAGFRAVAAAARAGRRPPRTAPRA